MYGDETGKPKFTEYGQEDASDTLEGDPGDDPLDQGIIAPDRWSAAGRYGTTADEEEAGESLDQLLDEEEPEPDPYAVAGDETGEDAGRETGGDTGGDTGEDAAEAPDATPAGGYSADPRAGRLVGEDEGAHLNADPDLVARDVGIDAGAASAEEAAVHTLDSGSEDTGDEDPEAEAPGGGDREE
jgi:Family of unknown function (DUF5709)